MQTRHFVRVHPAVADGIADACARGEFLQRLSETALKELKKANPNDPFIQRMIGRAHEKLGDKDKAFEWLEKDFQNRNGGLTLIKVEPFLDSLHGDPRFADLVRRIGLPP